MDVFWKVYRQIHQALGSGPVDLPELARVHWEIYEAVADKNKTLASERLQRHFDGIRQKLKDVAALAGSPPVRAGRDASRNHRKRLS